jgi:hypothetical protein
VGSYGHDDEGEYGDDEVVDAEAATTVVVG